MNVILFEKVIIKFLYTDIALRDKLIPFLTSDVFDDISNKTIVTKYLKFKNEYDTFPTVKEMELFIDDVDTYKQLISIMDLDLTEYNDEYLLDEVEEFFRKKLIFTDIFTMVEVLKKEKSTVISENIGNLQNSSTFSFDTKIGTDIFTDTKRLYNDLHDDSRVISTGIESLDKLIKGGLHEKTLTLFMGECVTKDTKVKVRFRLKR